MPCSLASHVRRSFSAARSPRSCTARPPGPGGRRPARRTCAPPCRPGVAMVAYASVTPRLGYTPRPVTRNTSPVRSSASSASGRGVAIARLACSASTSALGGRGIRRAGRARWFSSVEQSGRVSRNEWAGQRITRPPSARRTWPVMKLPASDASNSAGPTISSGCAAAAHRRRVRHALLRLGRCCCAPCRCRRCRARARSTRMPERRALAAIARVNDMQPRLGRRVHRARSATHRNAPAEITFTTARVRALLEVRKRGLDEEHRPAQVHAERLVPRLGRELAERLGQRVGGVVDDDVDAAEAVDGACRPAPASCVELAQVGRARRAPRRPARRSGGPRSRRRRRPCGWRRRPWRPRHTKPSAMARPMPRVPPVTMATRPVRSNSVASVFRSIGPHRPPHSEPASTNQPCPGLLTPVGDGPG